MTAPRTGTCCCLCARSDRNKVISTLQHYALTDDKDELVRVPMAAPPLPISRHGSTGR